MAESSTRNTTFKLDDLDGALQDVSTILNSVGGLVGTTERPPTTTLTGDTRREVKGRRDGGPISLGGAWRNASLAQVHGLRTKLLFDKVALTGNLYSGSLNRTVNLPVTRRFGNEWLERAVVGRKNAELTLMGNFDNAASAVYDQFNLAMDQATPVIVSIGYDGFAIGSIVDLLQVVQGNFTINTPDDDLVQVEGRFENDGTPDMGVSLHDLASEGAVTNFTSVNETEASANGGVGVLHVTAITGTPAGTIKIQHSTDNSVWVDLITFSSVTAAVRERIELAAGTTVNQYVRAIISAIGGASTMTFQVSFARRDWAYGSAGSYRHIVGLYGKQLSSSFEYGPEGGTSGKKKISGECRESSLTTDFSDDALTRWTAQFVTTGALTFGAF